MKMNLQRIAVRAATIGFVSVAVVTTPRAEPKTVRMGTEGYYPPFNYFDSSGKVKGFDIDIGNALCRQMEVTCEWLTTDWDGMIPALNAGKFDTIVASMSITDQRSAVVSFTHPYYYNPGGFYARKDSGFTAAMPEDLKGKVVGALSSTTEVKILEEYFQDSELKLYPKFDDALLDLEAGRIDLVMGSSFIMNEWLETEPGACCELVGDIFIEDFNNGTGIAVRRDDSELLDALNIALEEIMANGTYRAIRDKYFDFDIMAKPKTASDLFE